MTEQAPTVLLAEYIQLVDPTDKMPPELHPVLFGLYGEVGSVMATSKKHHREKENYVGFRRAVVEEFGDVLWYLVAIGRRLEIPIEETFAEALQGDGSETAVAASGRSDWPLLLASRVMPAPDLDPSLLRLGVAAADLLTATNDNAETRRRIKVFVTWYLKALQASGMTFGEIANYNATKTRGRFLEQTTGLPTFDDEYEEDERLPANFEIKIFQRKSGKSYLQWNGVFLGDPLTDNILGEDGYRFHDVFHLAHAAVLHWSPVFRGLIKHKRKSNPEVDEKQDGGRASVVEEGLTAWIFARAKEIGFYAGRESISFDILKTVQTFVTGYEVERCPLKLWESAILQGYRAFLQLRERGNGILVGNRGARTLLYRPLDTTSTDTTHPGVSAR